MLYLKFNKSTHCLFYTFLFFYSIHFIHAQHNKSEALNSNEYSADTTKANELNHLSWALKFQKPDSSIALAEKALALINKYNHLNNTTHQIHLTRTYLNLGVFYHIQTNLPKALEYYHRSLKTAEKIANTRRVAMANNNIGLVYDEMKEYDKALNYYKKTLPFYETSNDYSGLAEVLKNCAIIYFKQHNYLESLKNSKKALEVTQKNEKLIVSPNQLYDNTITQAELLNNIGSCLIKTNNSVDSAYNYYLKALAINEKLKNNSGISKTLCNIADIKIKKGDFDGAENNLIRAKEINSTVNDKIALLDLEKMFLNLYDTIAKIAYRKKDYSKAASHFHKAILNYKNIDELKDSVFSQENKKQIIQKELYYEFEKKEAQIKAENEKQQAIAHQKSRNKNIIITGAGIVVVLLILFSVFIFRSLKTTQHQKKLIELKNGELEIHRKIIEEKNKDITDSINYAQRIQKALLREEEYVSKHLPEHFILFMPKDIVSGDFYWGAEKKQYWYFAVADCTGHGVPGAIMSMLGISFLNDIISVEEVESPAIILDKLSNRLINELRQTDETIGNKDGMDISLCCLNTQTRELQWAGANNSLILIQNNTLIEIKPDKQPIGYYVNHKLFTNHLIQLQKNDCIYIYSDGYADQFGGEKGKKFKYKKLEEQIKQMSTLPMAEQKKLLKQQFDLWKGALEQVDDVCVLGVRV